MPATIPYRDSAGPLYFPLNRPGIKAKCEGEWNAYKHGGSKRRLWRKIYIGIDQETLHVGAIETQKHSIKLTGQRLCARGFDRQVAKIQMRAAILNGFTALGIPKIVAVG